MNEVKDFSKFEAWIFNSFNPNAKALGLYRIFCGLFLLFFLLPYIGLDPIISSLPNDFFAPPPGPMMLFDGFPAYGVLLLIHGLLILSLCMMTMGWQTLTTSLISGILLLVLKGFIYSTGKINHELLIAVVPLLMAFSGWGNAYSVDSYFKPKKERAEGWTFTLLALIIGFMFFTAGFSKIIGGWLDVDSHAALGHFFKHYFVRNRQDLLADYMLQITNYNVWELFDYATVLFETGFLVAIFYSKAIRTYVSLAVIFHFSTMMVMNISFLPNFLAYAAFLNWNFINKKLQNVISGSKISKGQAYWFPPLAIIMCMALLFGATQVFDSTGLLKSDWGFTGVMIVSAALLVALYYLGSQCKKLFKR